MSYEKPQVTSVSVEDLLASLGPARATEYHQQVDCPWWQYMTRQCRA